MAMPFVLLREKKFDCIGIICYASRTSNDLAGMVNPYTTPSVLSFLSEMDHDGSLAEGYEENRHSSSSEHKHNGKEQEKDTTKETEEKTKKEKEDQYR